MSVEEILREVSLDLPRFLRSHAEAGGSWESVFLGLGIESSGWRSWRPGDRLRDVQSKSFLRAKALGRKSELLSREYTGQREMRITLMLDISHSLLKSGGLPSLNALSAKKSAETFTALILTAAVFWGIPIRFVVKDGNSFYTSPQKQGIEHVRGILNQIDFLPLQEASELISSNSWMRRPLVEARGSLVFFLSDFADEKGSDEAAAMFREAHLRNKVDVVPVLADTFWIWEKFRGIREVLIYDPVSGKPYTVVTDREGLDTVKHLSSWRNDALTSSFLRSGIPWIHLREPDITGYKEEITRCFVEKRRRS